MTATSAESIERWTARRRVALVVIILNGETSVAAWREEFLLGTENALRSRPKDDEAMHEGGTDQEVETGDRRSRAGDRRPATPRRAEPPWGALQNSCVQWEIPLI